MKKNMVSLVPDIREELEEGVKIHLAIYHFEYTPNYQEAELQIGGKQIESNKLKIIKEKEKCTIFFQKKVHFFRGLSLLMQNKDKEYWELEETSNFESNGIMLDCSRNCVPKIETIKTYLSRLAMFGMNRLYLYMEDTLEIEEYPYWGYLRGRYSKDEIKECDQYARIFGIVLVPCIQTLAHLRSVLNQPIFAEYKDIDDILLLESENTQKLLKALLNTVAECFSGRIVHLGMDEASNLGRGKYLDQNGYYRAADIMRKHLEWLAYECEILHLEPIIWSDMFLKLNFGVEDYYSLSDEVEISAADPLAARVSLCYWDYYNEGTDFYGKYLRLHQKLGNKIIFAGGAWTWNGISPGISKAIKTTRDALQACCNCGVKDVFCTVWMDNGAEVPLSALLPIMALYGEYGFSENPSSEDVAERFRFCLDREWDHYLLLDAFDNAGYEENRHNRYCENPSKTIFYEDNLMGLFSRTVDEIRMREQYRGLEKRLREILSNTNKLNEEDVRLFEYYHILSEILLHKAGITDSMKKAYEENNLDELKRIIEGDLRKIEKLTEELRVQREKIWMSEYKPFGYEILDIRLAGVSVRAKSAAKRLYDFVTGNIADIPELEADILPYKTKDMLKDELLHGFYMWERIISRGNMDGV